MGSYGQAGGMGRNKMPLFTRIDHSLPIKINFNLTGQKRSLIFYCKNYANVSVKLPFIPAPALVGMRSIYKGQLVRSVAAPFILRMHACVGGVAYT